MVLYVAGLVLAALIQTANNAILVLLSPLHGTYYDSKVLSRYTLSASVNTQKL